MAARFDWREHELVGPQPGEARPGHWPDFRYTNIYERYEPGVAGYDQWQALVRSLEELSDGPQEGHERVQAFDTFLAGLPRVHRTSGRQPAATCCLFISHQRADTQRGERLACLADHCGLPYWLDVHNPTLTWASGQPIPAAIRSLLIAAVVEIGLLNSTHVITVHTKHSLQSRWVPYELGRAKARGLTSTQAAGWFEAGQTPVTAGDYVQLAVMKHSEQDVLAWFGSWGWGLTPNAKIWPNCNPHTTAELN